MMMVFVRRTPRIDRMRRSVKSALPLVGKVSSWRKKRSRASHPVPSVARRAAGPRHQSSRRCPRAAPIAVSIGLI